MDRARRPQGWRPRRLAHGLSPAASTAVRPRRAATRDHHRRRQVHDRRSLRARAVEVSSELVDLSGHIIDGKYQLVSIAGEGGMATVYKAVVRGAAGFQRT